MSQDEGEAWVPLSFYFIFFSFLSLFPPRLFSLSPYLFSFSASLCFSTRQRGGRQRGRGTTPRHRAARSGGEASSVLVAEESPMGIGVEALASAAWTARGGAAVSIAGPSLAAMAHVFRLCLSSPPSCPEAGATLHAIVLSTKHPKIQKQGYNFSPSIILSIPNHHNSTAASSTASSNRGRRLPNLLPNSSSEGDGGGVRTHRDPSSPGRRRALGGRRRRRGSSLGPLLSRAATRARRATAATRELLGPSTLG
uniref:Uncharacterized protein n=1 Tax=Oryza meridionalis TaxID=40149 RepID=A0A0E0DYK6_9ORYZ